MGTALRYRVPRFPSTNDLLANSQQATLERFLPPSCVSVCVCMLRALRGGEVCFERQASSIGGIRKRREEERRGETNTNFQWNTPSAHSVVTLSRKSDKVAVGGNQISPLPLLSPLIFNQ